MQNCKNPNWNIKQSPITISARLDGTNLVIVDAQGSPLAEVDLAPAVKAVLAEVDLAPAVQAVLDAQKKKTKKA